MQSSITPSLAVFMRVAGLTLRGAIEAWARAGGGGSVGRPVRRAPGREGIGRSRQKHVEAKS